jgi:hypothetical protein
MQGTEDDYVLQRCRSPRAAEVRSVVIRLHFKQRKVLTDAADLEEKAFAVRLSFDHGVDSAGAVFPWTVVRLMRRTMDSCEAVCFDWKDDA